MSRCRFCEKKIQPGDKFCLKCGAEIPEEDFQPSPVKTDYSLSQALDNIEDPFEKTIAETFATQGKIPAIKLYRQETGAGLKDAKDAVEVLAQRYGIKPTGAGCAGMIMLCLIVSGMCIRLFVMPG